MRNLLRTKAARIGLAAALTATGLTMTAASAGAQSSQPTYLNQHARTDARVADLLKRMTLEEKVGQMTQIAVARLRGDCEWTNGDWRADCLKAVFDDAKTGSILSGGGMTPPSNTPKAWAEMVNYVQKYAIEHSRLRIPIIYGVDAVHGHNNVSGATIFPHQIGLGSSWDDALVRDVGAATSKVVKATGPTWNFAPVSDLARDARWGRYYEAFSEDPVLAGSLAGSTVKGMEATGQVASTVKHFGGYSEPFNGHDRTNTDVSMRYLQDTLLPPYKAQVDAGADTLMANSGAVNGIPAHASKYLLTDVVRKQWGFKGVVITDWRDVKALEESYHIAGDYKHAIAASVNAGVDMAMEPYSAKEFTDGLLAAVREGLVPRKRIDEATSRILRLKFERGLFERPYVDAAKADGIVLNSDTALARKAAAESLVLLRNQGGALPLAAGKKIVVTGESADSLPNQMGGWTIGWQGMADGDKVPGQTVLAGLRAGAPSGTTVEHATTKDDAVDKTEDADAAVVVVGEKPGAEGTNDKEVPAFTAEQQDLVAALKATGKPVIAVLITGRPLVLGKVNDADAVLAAWLPGSEGGNAVADAVYGKTNPTGVLPVSWPKSVGDMPMYYQQLPGTNAGESSGYDPQYAFGHGLSYTGFAVQGLTLGSASTSRNGMVKVSVRVANTGARDGDMIVPVYAAQPVSRVLVPPKRLAGYARVPLKAGEAKTVTLSVPLSRLALTAGDVNGAGDRTVLPGAYKILAGDKAADLTVR
ncbi:glycoside hydrolase family 3 N-terminal domain-containing protein [Actinomadura sp. HBU206391]|uniref:glycoside hydrolase family 3 N-terminal domain-containing protein n=1 Tax=Actinomadura sp. HBU206391 TaxID=2731692 RepID=UPI00164F75AB|nr:glycoside hydrolase family 3 N-terminal domain-containing protein [Actinomadura sp. HBU206391]MBC6460474.1 glycoside hydrolase family 3 C-terminal domain-containing protein [Actinomadura sp. HBU206391]